MFDLAQVSPLKKIGISMKDLDRGKYRLNWISPWIGKREFLRKIRSNVFVESFSPTSREIKWQNKMNPNN